MLPTLIQALLTDPACYDHPVAQLELVETHISWVVLTGFFAYKIKKPVNLGFLDFSTLALREQDCHDELRLNRRLAVDYYLDVIALTGNPDAPRINGSGETLEYAVQMRQFPADATLDRLAGRGELNALHIDALAARLARFHLTECERATAESPWGEAALIAQPVAENIQVLARCAEADELADLRGWCGVEHARLAPLMRARKENGLVRECHGDLHLANLAWVDGGLVIFDALEFSPALRWIDVISEVAFCYMDLLHRKYAALAARFLNAWLEATGDYQGVELLRYYAVYRALVRAKVAALRVEQGCAARVAEMNECLQLAKQLASIPPSASPSFSCPFPLVPSPSLYITHGFSGSGKTTLSQQLLEKLGLIRLRSDVERKRLAGLDACARGGEALGIYSESFGLRTYQHLAELAEDLLLSGWSVVVDAAFLMRWERDMFRDLAQRVGADFGILDIQVEPEILRERVRRRQAAGSDASDADLRVLEQQLITARLLDADEMAVCLGMELM
jgi:aminoglycoside phosphotransferase family enzyme/predicted kinase